ncbi:DUF4422 domain-containing protein [Methanocorpusculum sp. MG]|uniref:DUF4422 domain-containing protein n=2 Tax=Methanocorpusculum petauri TaxID=3002863 RepID=A0ABT4IGD8_9EURY|nr:DUF4422 domain-containing protein [Methanocorpusculum petauri]
MSLLPKTEQKDDLAVYVMTHGPECTWLADYCIPLEIGAACRDKHCCELRDDLGEDTISEKDRLYCELTGLYWMWKNDQHEYAGLYHYRRVFKLTSKQIHKYLSAYDFILPKKFSVYPNIAEHLCHCHIPKDWDILNDVLKEMYPDYYESSKTIFQKRKLFAANMFITGTENFHQYCDWLFPLLDQIEQRLDLHDGRSEYNMRAIGFLAERLFHLYILHNNFKVKEVKIWFVPPYVSISSKCPRPIARFAMSNIYLYNAVLLIQNTMYAFLQRIHTNT